MTRLLALAASAIALAASAPALAQDVTITNARLVIGDGSAPIEGGTVAVRGGTVVYAGPAAGAPAGGQTVDAKGAFVTPGIFATITTLGLADVGAVSDSNDISAGKTPFSAALDASKAINPTSQHILVHKTAGITRAATTLQPAGSIFAGQGAIIDLDGDPDPVVQARAFQMIVLGEGGRPPRGARAPRPTRCCAPPCERRRHWSARRAFRRRPRSTRAMRSISAASTPRRWCRW